MPIHEIRGQLFDQALLFPRSFREPAPYLFAMVVGVSPGLIVCVLPPLPLLLEEAVREERDESAEAAIAAMV